MLTKFLRRFKYIRKILSNTRLLDEWYEEQRHRQQLEDILNRNFTKEELRRADHFLGVERKNRRLREEVRRMQLRAERFNQLLYATGLIVRCTGCIAGAPDNYADLTEEKVHEVERIAERLRAWWEANKNRIAKT